MILQGHDEVEDSVNLDAQRPYKFCIKITVDPDLKNSLENKKFFKGVSKSI